MTAPKRLAIATLIILAIAGTIALWIANAEARPRPRLAYAIVECPSWPWVGDSAINADLRQLTRRTRGKRRWLSPQGTLRLQRLRRRWPGTMNTDSTRRRQ